MLAGKGLVHHAVDRLAAPGQRDQRAPGRQAADEGFGAVDGVEHPDIFGVGAFGAEFLAQNTVLREGLFYQRAHGGFGGAVGGGDRIEVARAALVLDAECSAKERPDRFARNIGEVVDERAEIDRRHEIPSRRVLPMRHAGRQNDAVNSLSFIAGVRLPIFCANLYRNRETQQVSVFKYFCVLAARLASSVLPFGRPSPAQFAGHLRGNAQDLRGEIRR